MNNDSLAEWIKSSLLSRLRRPLSADDVRDIERELLSVAHRWAQEHGYSLDGWSCLCHMPPLTEGPGEPVPVRVMRDGMVEPTIELGEPTSDVGQLTVLLRDPIGVLVELDAADWMIRNRWNRGLGWGG